MKLSDFDYQIPEDRIALHPLKKRDSSRLFVLQRKTGRFDHRVFREIVEYLIPGDLLVLNDTMVIPMRLIGAKPSGGRAEITLLKELDMNIWEALVKGVHVGSIILGHGITADVSRLNGTLAKVEFDLSSGQPETSRTDIKDFLNEIGLMPLPVYIKRDAVKADSEQYQTVYAKKEGAVAAPTAGLHFTGDLLDSIRSRGVHVMTITLHVGYGTFRPVTANDIRDHQMDKEFYEIPGETADAVNAARSEGRRVIAVGTTVTRTLETAAGQGGRISPGAGNAAIFIYPGFKFRVIDALITNFHLPGSTPMMLASAFSGLRLLKKAYAEAGEKAYRLFSYGDAMFIT